MTAESHWNPRHTARYLAILRCIDAGVCSVPSIAARHPEYGATMIRDTIHKMQQRRIVVSIRRGQSGRPALYALRMTLAEAEAKTVPAKAKRWRASAIEQALGTPPAIAATIAMHAKPRKVERMGRWDAPMGRPKSAAKAYA